MMFIKSGIQINNKWLFAISFLVVLFLIFVLLKFFWDKKESFRCGETDEEHKLQLNECIRAEENKMCGSLSNDEKKKCIGKTRLHCPHSESCSQTKDFITKNSSNKSVGKAESSIMANQCQTKCNNIRMCCFNKNSKIYSPETDLKSKIE